MSEDFHLFVNGRVFHAEHGARELMTGAQIADLVGVPANRAVIRLDPKIDPKDLRVDTFCPPRLRKPTWDPGLHRCSYHSHSERPRCLLSGREVTDQEPSRGHAHVTHTALRIGAGKTAGDRSE
jgi:hypothetical protein